MNSIIYYAPLHFSDKGRKVVWYDLETMGLKYHKDQILEIGAYKVIDGKKVAEFHTYIKPSIPIPKEITDINHIDDETVKDAPYIREALREFLYFVDGAMVAGHNIVGFDNDFINANARFWLGEWFRPLSYDTLELAKLALRIPNTKKEKDEFLANKEAWDVPNAKLQTLADYFHIDPGVAHTAISDVNTNFLVSIELQKRMTPQFADHINKFYFADEEAIF
jgi:DNA polymerase III epsilon subunit-like protein